MELSDQINSTDSSLKLHDYLKKFLNDKEIFDLKLKWIPVEILLKIKENLPSYISINKIIFNFDNLIDQFENFHKSVLNKCDINHSCSNNKNDFSEFNSNVFNINIIPVNKDWRKDGFSWETRVTTSKNNVKIEKLFETQKDILLNKEKIGKKYYFKMKLQNKNFNKNENSNFNAKTEYYLRKRCVKLNDLDYYIIQYLIEENKDKNLENMSIKNQNSINLPNNLIISSHLNCQNMKKFSLLKIHPLKICKNKYSIKSKNEMILIFSDDTFKFNKIESLTLELKNTNTLITIFMDFKLNDLEIINNSVINFDTYRFDYLNEGKYLININLKNSNHEQLSFKYDFEIEVVDNSYQINSSFINESFNLSNLKSQQLSLSIEYLDPFEIHNRILKIFNDIKIFIDFFFNFDYESYSMNKTNENGKNNIIQQNTSTEKLLEIENQFFTNKIYIKLESINSTKIKNFGNSEEISYEENDYLEFLNLYISTMKSFNKNPNLLLLKQDSFGYNIIHYIVALDYSEITIKLIELSNEFITLRDRTNNLGILDISCKKNNLNTIIKLLQLNNNSEKTNFSLSDVQKAFNIALVNKAFYNQCNKVDIVYLLLKQLKIELLVQQTSDNIIESIDGEDLKVKYINNDILNVNNECKMINQNFFISNTIYLNSKNNENIYGENVIGMNAFNSNENKNYLSQNINSNNKNNDLKLKENNDSSSSDSESYFMNSISINKNNINLNQNKTNKKSKTSRENNEIKEVNIEEYEKCINEIEPYLDSKYEDIKDSSILLNLKNEIIEIEEEKSKDLKLKCASYIQNCVRTWLKRNRYIDLKKSTNKLQNYLKNHIERKKFVNIKNATLTIQKAFRQFLLKK